LDVKGTKKRSVMKGRGRKGKANRKAGREQERMWKPPGGKRKKVKKNGIRQICGWDREGGGEWG
jgi:hypothetical protein